MTEIDVEQLRPLIESIVAETVERVLAEQLRGRTFSKVSPRPIGPRDNTPLVGADKQHGYRLGCEGFVSTVEARELLGGISLTTLKRRVRDGMLRRGKHPSTRRNGICLRSLREYIERMKT